VTQGKTFRKTHRNKKQGRSSLARDFPIPEKKVKFEIDVQGREKCKPILKRGVGVEKRCRKGRSAGTERETADRKKKPPTSVSIRQKKETICKGLVHVRREAIKGSREPQRVSRQDDSGDTQEGC